REQNEQERAANRDLEQEARREQAQSEPEETYAEIGHDLADEDLAGANRRDEKGFERAAFPLARHHERGEEGTDQRHDDDDQSGYEKPRAGVRLVEPDALLDADRADAAGKRGRFGSARGGQRDRAFSIRQHHARTIRV